MKKQFLLIPILLIILTTTQVRAKIVTQEQALKVAQNFFIERAYSSSNNLDASTINIRAINIFEIEGVPAIYAFSNHGQGFILISADDALTPILGYAYEGTISPPGENANFDYLISDYINQVKYVRTNSVPASSEVNIQWDQYSNFNFDHSPLADVTIGPLITSMWNQMFPYNEFCPAAANGVKVPTGCVATAMSMLMYYYRYPVTGSGQHSYTSSNYGIQKAAYGSTTYNWDAMQNTISSNSGDGIPANATLQFHAGVAVNMGYAPGGSGAFSGDVPYALKTYFKYSVNAQYLAKSNYFGEWEDVLTAQLDLNRPLYYSGSDGTGGHAWVCDGYQKTGTTKKFHFNFGWGGSSNGYYTSSNPVGYTSDQAVVRGVYPGSNYPYGCSSKVLEYSRGSIEDGSGPLANYENNLSCTWLIAPKDTVSAITVKFVRFDLSSSDTLYFYNGENAKAPLLAAYSGNNLPKDVTSTGNKMFIQFITDATVQDTGWLIEYSSALPVLCRGSETMTAPIGSFSDGSGPYNYLNNSTCRYIIAPPFATSVTLAFSEFDLKEGDKIQVYRLSDNASIDTLSGSTIPKPITVTNDGLYLLFASNAYTTGTGFKASYSIGNVGNPKLKDVLSLNISPNPARENIIIRAYNVNYQHINFILKDITGKTLVNETMAAQKGDFEKVINVSTLSPGMYFLTMMTNEGKSIKKIIVN